MQIAIVGLGAIGVYVAHELDRGGVRAVGFSRRKVDSFEIVTAKGRETFSMESHDSIPEDQHGRFDLLIFCLKNNVLAQVVGNYAPLLKDDGVVVCAQNGVMEYTLMEHFPADRILGAQVKAGCNLTPPAQLDVTLPLSLVVGPAGQDVESPRLSAALEFLGRQSFIKTVPDILPFKWTKLIFTCVMNPLSAITGLNADKLMKNRDARPIMMKVIEEALQVAEKEGIRLVAEGPFHPAFFGESHWLPRPLKYAAFSVFSLFLKDLKVSMLHDVQLGRPTEIDFINGFIVDRAGRHGIPTPYNETTIALIKEIEAGKLRSGVDNLTHY